MVFQPEAGMNERVILRSGGKVEPDSPESVKVAQRRVMRDVVIVVPNVTKMPNLLIRDQGQCDEDESFEGWQGSSTHGLKIACGPGTWTSNNVTNSGWLTDRNRDGCATPGAVHRMGKS